jgi:hypothetical protein
VTNRIREDIASAAAVAAAALLTLLDRYTVKLYKADVFGYYACAIEADAVEMMFGYGSSPQAALDCLARNVALDADGCDTEAAVTPPRGEHPYPAASESYAQGYEAGIAAATPIPFYPVEMDVCVCGHASTDHSHPSPDVENLRGGQMCDWVGCDCLKYRAK